MMRAVELFRHDELSELVFPIQFVRVGLLTRVPAPLVRITTCGGVSLEVLHEVISIDPPLARYRLVNLPERGKGSSTALNLLKLLVSLPAHAATRDWLAEHLPHHRWRRSRTQPQEEDDEEMEAGLLRVDNVVTALRKLLCPPYIEGDHLLRPVLVAFLKNHQDSGPGYQLAPAPLIWLDVDEMASLVQVACQREQQGQEALSLWEEVYALSTRGSYLPLEVYSDWASDRREEIEGYGKQAVLALRRLYLVRDGQAAEERVLLLLRTYCRTHPTDEDVLRPLIELLGQRDCVQEALTYYRRLCSLLEEEGSEPDPRTQRLIEQVRTMPDREHAPAKPREAVPPSSPDTLMSLSPMDEQNCAFSPQGIQAETQAVEATSSPLSDDQEFLPLTDEPSEHAGPLLAETRHLLGRQEWLASIVALIQAAIPKKLLVLHGPIGVGKSSELNRLAHAFVQQNTSQVMVLSLPAREPRNPEASLDLFLGMLLSESRAAPFPADASRQTRIKLALTTLAERPQPSVILLDNAEGTLTEEGTLAPCWEALLTCIVRGQHQATLILATKEWPGWPGRDPQLVAEIPVPPLTLEDSVLLLQRLGLESVPLTALKTISQRVACIPLCLEWIAKIAHDPLVHDAWEDFEVQEETSPESHLDAVQRLTRLLEHPTLLGEHLASRLTPLLEHILDQHLSPDARRVLEHLAVVGIPFGKPALYVFCSRPAWLKELRNASLLTAYTNRIQVLPTVASTVKARLSPEQVYELEERMIEALTRWVENGNISDGEAGHVVTELAGLFLTHHHLLDAAQLLIRCGWMTFKLGYGPRLALLAREALDHEDWHRTAESECAGLVLIQLVFPFLGKSIETNEYVNFQCIRDAFLEGTLVLQAATEGYVVHLLLLHSMNDLRFTEAQAILDVYYRHLKAHYIHPEQHESWLQKQALLFGTWCEHLEERGETEQARAMREQTIALYRERAALLADQQGTSRLKQSLRMRGLASCFSYLGYHLHRMGSYDEALQMIDQAIRLQEQGYGNIGVLASSYSDKSQILIGLGHLQEAIMFDEKAMAEIQRCAVAGDAISQEDRWTYVVNRGHLYLRLGRVEEAEQLLLDALPHIHAGRRKYRMFAEESLHEIEQWHRQTVSPQYQLDWRWIERYRELVSYDSYWWLTWAGPFTEEEQQEWNRLSTHPLDTASKTQLSTLMKLSRERELTSAMIEQREPCLHYPAIDVEDVCRRIAAHLQMRAEIDRNEPHAIVRRLYQGAIEEELDYLHLIEATYEHNTEQFRECSLRLFPLPTHEEMLYALRHIQRTLSEGLNHPETAPISQQLQDFLQTHLSLSWPLPLEEEELPETQRKASPTQSQGGQKISAQAARRFFETVFKESGYEGWNVIIDANATGARVEQGARALFLPAHTISLANVKHLFVHELAGHVARCVAGERSPLGLLGLHTKNVASTEEGFTLYHERQIAIAQGQRWNDSGMRLSTFAIGLASGIMGPSQTFRSICSFVESFSLLRRLLKHPEKGREQHQKHAQEYAFDHCLRVFRGVPDLTQAGVCYPQDAIYLHGLFMIEKAVAQDRTVLDRLAVGKVALELLPDLQELGITTTSLPSLYPRAYDLELDAYILSFAEAEHT